jgi:acetolactate synthase-1/2/3 large subunit
MAKHEQGAGHMAEGYTRATGQPGVVLVTCGFGATNLITPLQDALCDGTAMVVICGQAPRKSNKAGNFLEEEADIVGITKSCTKWNITVQSIEDLPRRIDEAFEIAKSGRPGPVLVYIPRYVAAGHASFSAPMDQSLMKRLNPTNFVAPAHPLESMDKTLDRISQLIKIAKKPLLYVGQGMLARPEGPAILKEFADKACIPVTTSLQGLGAFDELDPKALHMLGLHGAAYANLAIQNADLIIALGARFDDRITGSIPKFAPQALIAAREKRGGIVHFEIAPKNINKVVQATESIVGDCTASLTHLIPRIDTVTDRPEWFGQIQQWKTRFPFSAYNRHPTTPVAGQIRAQAVVEKLSDMTEHMKERTIISTGVGQHQMWAAQQFRWRCPRTMLTSGGLGTMGYGLPAAIGAKVARPDCLVIDIDGDASFNMTMNELLTAAKYNIGVKVLLFNNEQMGMVSDLQRLYYNHKFVHNRQKNPDFLKLSEAFGVGAARCSEPDDVEAKLKWLIEHDGPAVLEVVTEQNSPVWPVVPAGKGLDEFVTYSALEVDGKTSGSLL